MTVRRDSTMFVAVHGEVTPHPWRDGRVASADAYSLFVARCSAMGWLTEAREHTFDGFWSMNDAGQDAGPHTRVAWFQVSLTEPVHAGRPLPVQPFLSCAHDVVARSGALRLRAVQVLLAVQSLAERPPPGALADLLQDAGWFADAEPGSRTGVRVTVDTGQHPVIGPAAPEMLRSIQRLRQDVFACDTVTPDDGATEDLTPAPAVIDALWSGPAEHRATFQGTLAEGSLDALGWLAALFAEVGHAHGVRTPVLFTARLADP